MLVITEGSDGYYWTFPTSGLPEALMSLGQRNMHVVTEPTSASVDGEDVDQVHFEELRSVFFDWSERLYRDFKAAETAIMENVVKMQFAALGKLGA